MEPIDAAEWRGQLLADMSKRELIDVIAQLIKAQRAELEYVRQSRDIIAEALMQERERATAIERERCAKIAETPDRGRSWVPGSLWETLAREQSAAIRSQTL